jgi:hypothetical protein
MLMQPELTEWRQIYTLFVVFNTKEFRIMAASIGSDFYVFKLELKLI